MTVVHPKLQLKPKQWYGWQMLPGYNGEQYAPYCSPIFVEEVVPRKTGRGIITVGFFNALYASGVNDFALDLRILKREAKYLVSEIIDNDGPALGRTGIISLIEFEWIQRFCSGLWSSHPPSSFALGEQRNVSHYLNALFGR